MNSSPGQHVDRRMFPSKQENIALVIVLLVAFLSALGGGCQSVRSLGGFGERLVDVTTGDTPRKAAVQMEDQYFPDERRQGITALADREWGRKSPYVERYAQIAATDPDYLVRATAIRALNRSRDKSATPLFVKALEDSSEIVRLEAAKALVNMPDEKAAPILVRMVTNPQESKDVRIAAADALKHYKSLAVARVLIAQLRGRDYGIAWQSRASLKALTGQDLRYNETEWLNLVTGPEKPFG